MHVCVSRSTDCDDEEAGAAIVICCRSVCVVCEPAAISLNRDCFHGSLALNLSLPFSRCYAFSSCCLLSALSTALCFGSVGIHTSRFDDFRVDGLTPRFNAFHAGGQVYLFLTRSRLFHRCFFSCILILI